MFDVTGFDNRDDIDIFDYQYYSNINTNRAASELDTYENQETLPKEVEVKPKVKKQVVTQLKYEGDLSVYELKIRYYREFIFMVNLTHRIFDPLILKDIPSLKVEGKYKFYLGKGNNYLLVKSLLKRRFWWTIEEDPKKANFVWTQLKLNYFYQLQKKAEPQQKFHKLDKDFETPSSPKKKKKKNQNETKQPTKAGIYRAPLPASDKKIFTQADKKFYDEFLEKAENPEKLLKYTSTYMTDLQMIYRRLTLNFFLLWN